MILSYPININVPKMGALVGCTPAYYGSSMGLSRHISEIQNGDVTMKEWPTLSSQPKNIHQK
jgi:hypothetical protein